MSIIQDVKTKYIEYWQDGEWMGLVEPVGAEHIKTSAVKAGYKVYDGDFFFNVEYAVSKEEHGGGEEVGAFDDDNY